MKRIILFIILMLFAITLFLLVKNGRGFEIAKSTKPIISTSIYPLYYFASVIAGDKLETKVITPSGIEPHEYELTAQDRVQIEQSRLLILNGYIESWGEKVVQSLKGTTVHTITTGDGIINGADPHVWLDPLLAKKQVEAITQAIISIDPQNETIYAKRSSQLVAQLTALDEKYRKGLATCSRKDIITSHEAFSYLSKAYGLTQVSIAGLSTEIEPSTKQLAEISAFARTHNVKYIFFESMVSPKLSQTIAQEVGAQTMVLDPLEGLSQDDIQNGKNYFTVMEENLHNLQIALQCTR